MTIKVIGAGIGRTGTTSLQFALEQLGFGKCYHMEELMAHPEKAPVWQAASRGQPVDWDALLAGYQSIVDFPGYRLYRELMRQYPEAKVILTVRDPDQWYASAYETLFQAPPKLGQKILMSFRLPFSRRLRQLVRVYMMAENLVWKGDFENRFADKAFALEKYRQHNAEVERVVPPEKLLTYDVKQGWGPLCRFLGVPEPAGTPFPHLNTRAEFVGSRGRK